MKILSIETSCDETAISILDFRENAGKIETKILSNVLRSQIEIHKEFGGVFPNLAKREHAKNLPIIFLENLKKSGLYEEQKNILDEETKDKLRKALEHEKGLDEEIIKIFESIKKPGIENIVVTSGPGLEPALWVGINFAKALNIIWGIKVIPANHMEGHILSVFLDSSNTETQAIDLNKINFPALALLISGGHTELVTISEKLEYKKIGKTLDDAIGEAFDKVARLLGLPYPGGPEISRLAKISRDDPSPRSESRASIKLPRPMINSGDYNFSFSGIKTAVLYLIKKIENLDEQTKKDIAKEFEEAVTEVIVSKTKKALEEFNIKTLIIGGGVSANSFIKKSFEELIAEKNKEVELFFPDSHMSGDNSVMIGLVGILKIIKNTETVPITEIKADSNLSL